MKKKTFATKVQMILFNEAVNKIVWNNNLVQQKVAVKEVSLLLLNLFL